jgi:hypothetical protein
MKNNDYISNSAALSVAAASGTVGEYGVDDFQNILVVTQLSSLTGGTAPTVQFILDWKDAVGVYRPLITHAALSATGTKTAALGPGSAASTGIDLLWAAPFGPIVRLRWVTTGTPATAVAEVAIVGLKT